ncbi:MLP-like protein 28 [Fagus crenata]|uniref:Bet v I/Major latex protein domain-containing protein n=1 Tax=Fagus sylvatica TaxID=28930 RepID=A0A2N9FUQ0_FAGSY
MSLFGKVETDVEIKASAEKFHEVFSCRPHHISNVCPEKVQGVALHEGDWGKEGAVVCWDYVLDGKTSVAKAILEAIDMENKSVTYKVIEGDLMEHYKSIKLTIEVSPKDEGSLVHWIIQYEKLNEEIVDPHTLLQLAIDVTKDIDAHLTQA